MPSFAVVGHCEWVTFARVPALPKPGEIATASEAWDEPAGGGATAAHVMHRLARGASHFFTALGTDATGDRALAALKALGLHVHAAPWNGPHTTAFVHLTPDERTITVMHRGAAPHGDAPLPWHLLDQTDGVYFVKGDPAALWHARRARVLVATARILPLLQQTRVQLDALVHSAADPGEAYAPGQLDPPPRLVVSTEGSRGGRWVRDDGTAGRYEAAPLAGPIVDAYGAGDSFAAGLAFALGSQRPLDEALTLAARCGAEATQRRGAHG